jgi:replicative DNA helicase
MTDDLQRVPPHSLEAEQSLLGALLLDNMAWERVALILTPKDFYKGAHRKIYEQIELLIETGNPADVVTVSQALKDAGILDEIGGSAYLGLMAQSTPSSLNVKRYAELVREKSTLRNVIRACSEVIELAWAPGSDPEQALDEAERRVFELRSRRIAKPPATFKQLLGKVFEAIDERFHSDKVDGITGLRTGFENLDQMTAGMHPGDLIIVAGRPSMGKTAFAMNIAEHVGLAEKRPVAVFSLEMADVQLVQRMLGSVSRVDQHKLRTGRLLDEDWGKLTSGMEKLQDAPYLIEETMALSIGELRARARRIAKDNPGLAVIVIDYLQLMAGSKDAQNRATEVSEITRGLKGLAKELNIPVLALSQLSRAVEARVNKRPMMSDLRESGGIEQDADTIFFLYRDIVYNENSEHGDHAEVIIGKQRNGPIGHIYLRFVKEETRFENCGTWAPPKREASKKRGFVAKAGAEARQRADIDG